MEFRSARRQVGLTTAAGLLAALAVSPAAAQTLRMADSHATVIRGGTYASANSATDLRLATRASADPEYVRRIVMKFDTQNSIPQSTRISSATLTLTVAGGNAETRTLTAYRVTTQFEEANVTWTRRNPSANWNRAGGDLGEAWATASATNRVGAQVTFDVTALVQAAVNGTFGSSRYTRLAIVDAGGSSRDSYKEFHSDEAADASVRPMLTVTLGSTAAPAPTSPAPAPTSNTIRFVHWNIAHGVGTDGRYDLDRIAAALARTNPDVISLNEVERFTSWGNEDQPARFAALMRSRTGRTWYYHFASKFGTANGQGNLLLSTFPIEGTGSLVLSHTRSVAHIRIVVNGRPVSLFSTHLDADSGSRRATQMEELKRYMLQFPETRLVGGDFNTWPSAGEISRMTGTYFDVWAEAARLGTAVAYPGNTNGATRNSRIDYLFLSRGASYALIRGAQVYDVRDSSGVQPSDHRPLLGVFEIR